jgi:hypothetical protein
MDSFMISESPLHHLEVNLCVFCTHSYYTLPMCSSRLSPPHPASPIAEGRHTNERMRQGLIRLFFPQKYLIDTWHLVQ